MSNLRLSFLADADDALIVGCCPSQFYAVLFTPDGASALKLVSTLPDVWQLSEFFHAQQTSFAVPLEEDITGRSFLYTKDLLESEFVLPFSELPYQVEYWRRMDSGVDHDRDADSLITFEDMYWNGADKVAIILPGTEVMRFQSMEATAQVAYDSVSGTLTVLAYLLAAGKIVAGTSYASIHVHDSDGNSLAGQSTTTQIPNVPGAFKIVSTPVAFVADAVYSMTVVVRTNGIDYTSIVPIVVYD